MDAASHRALTIDQFTKQAIPFAQPSDKATGYDGLELLRDPSHVHALTREEFAALLREDVGVDRFGVAARWVGSELHYAVPVIVGVTTKLG